jgi:hypothetical protein
MTKRDADKPIGWVLPVLENSEGKALAAAWLEQKQEVLGMLHAAIAADIETRNGDSLLMWHVTLSGLGDELRTILTRAPAEVVPDRPMQ